MRIHDANIFRLFLLSSLSFLRLLSSVLLSKPDSILEPNAARTPTYHTTTIPVPPVQIDRPRPHDASSPVIMLPSKDKSHR